MRIAYTYDIARALFGVQPTDAELSSLRRALRRLRAAGLLQSWGRNELHWIMPRGVPKRGRNELPRWRVQQWLGHKTLTVTMRYAHLAPANLLAAVKALEEQPTLIVKVA
jgi:hypothetical protein